jgi:hypothetical protein
MRQTIKIKKDGQEVTFVCSECGNKIHDMFIPIGKIYEPDWNKIPEICECGARLANRRPIIDDDIETCYIDNNRTNISSRRNVRGNMSMSERADVYRRRIRDLEIAISIDYFNMRLDGLRRDNFQVPDDIDYLRMNCIKRNISYIETFAGRMSNVDDAYEKEEVLERLESLKSKYSDLSDKLENRKDFNSVSDQDSESDSEESDE